MSRDPPGGRASSPGSYVLTDTINRSFDDIFDEAFAGTDVADLVEDRRARQDSHRPARVLRSATSTACATCPVSRRRRAASSRSAASWTRRATRSATSFAPEFISSTAPEAVRDAHLHRGPPPQTSDEASIDESTADREGFEHRRHPANRRPGRGQAVPDRRPTSASATPRRRLQHRAAHASRGPAPDQQGGELDGISVKAGAGVYRCGSCASGSTAVLPPRLVVETGNQAAARQAQDIKDDLSFFRVVLLVFGGVALLGGQLPDLQHLLDHGRPADPRVRAAAHARREPAPDPRAAPSSRRSCSACSARASACPPASASPPGSTRVFKTFGIDLPNTGTVIETRTIVVALAVGHRGHACLGARAGAARHARDADGGTARGGAAGEPHARARSSRRFAVLLFLARHRDDVRRPLRRRRTTPNAAAALVGGGAVATLFGVSHVQPAPRAPARVDLRLAAREAAGITGRLARENAVRKPGRTAVTAGALMIGLAVVVFVTRVRRRHQRLGRECHRPQLPGRPRPPEHRRLLADQPRRRARRGARCRA